MTCTVDAFFAIGRHFRTDPVGFAEIVLGLLLSPQQKSILRNLCIKPYKVMVRSANSQGKSFIAAVAALWTFTCFVPSVIIITAPTAQQVQRIIFKELREIGKAYAGLFMPKASCLYHAPNHQILGYTSNTGTSFQGIHDATVCGIVDEAIGVDGEFVEALEPMIHGEGRYTLLLYNPTDTSTYPYLLERTGKAHVEHLSALEHPNIVPELQARPAPFPNAIRLERLREMIDLWCEPASPTDRQPEDFEFDGKLWHPSPVAEARLLGNWPSNASNAVWSGALFDACCSSTVTEEGTVQIGCDVAVYGDDDTAIAVRKGRCLVHLELHNGWNPNQTVARLKELSLKYRLAVNHTPPIVIDEGGVGIAVSCQGENFNFVGVNFGGSSCRPGEFRNKRDELHFTLADMARKGDVSFSRLSIPLQEVLRLELLAPTYSLDYQARRIVEKKDDIKKRIGKSPDAAEAVMLAFAEVYGDTFKIDSPIIRREPRKLGF